MNLKIQGTNVLWRNLEASTRIVVNEGGTRSSKTYSIAQQLIIEAMNEKNKIITICRKTLPSLKTTAMRDFFEILSLLELYDEKNHNRSEHTYKLNSNLFEFVSLDQPQKKRGAKRHKLWMNEANEFTLEDYRQLSFRTIEKIIMDYNPSDVDHWIYNVVIPRDDCTLIKSTYKDNTYLPKSLVEEIERLKDTDDTYWKIYGMGQRAVPSSVIYPKWKYFSDVPNIEPIYGLDFGYNNPAALVSVRFDGDDVYLKEELYQTQLTNYELIDFVKGVIQKDTHPYIYADCAEPDRIEEIYRAGLNVQKAKKDVSDGIDHVKRFNLFVHRDSINLIKEIKNYKWKEDRNGHILDEPVKFKDHLMDAMRYAIYTHGRDHLGKEVFGLPSASGISLPSVTRNILKGF